MKKYILNSIICFSIVGILFSQENNIEQDNIIEQEYVVHKEKIELDWQPTFKKALKKSKKQNKPILIYFTGSDWCGPCKILDKKLFHTAKFKEIADRDLILYEADDPRNKDLVSAEKLKITYNLKQKYGVRTFPTLVFVNENGNMIDYKKGLILTDYYYPFIASVVNNY